MDRKLFIRNVPFEANEDDLRIVFDSYVCPFAEGDC